MLAAGMVKIKVMIEEVTMYAATCDNCGKDWENDYHGWSAMTDELSLKNTLREDEWHFGDSQQNEGEDGKIYCPSCFNYDDEDVFHLKIVEKSGV